MTNDSQTSTKPNPTTTLFTILIALAMVTFPIAGAVSSLVTDDPTWVQTAKITPEPNPDPFADHHGFGEALATSGDSILIAQPGAETVYAYEDESTASWDQVQALTIDHEAFITEFGHTLDISGDTAVIGAPNIQTAFVYGHDGEAWQQAATLTTTHEENARFATSVAIHGDTIAIGAPHATVDTTERAGTIHLYQNTNNEWTHRTTITRETPQTGDLTGHAVALHDDTIAAIALGQGAAHVFETNDEDDWEQTADTLAQTDHARTIALAKDTLAVGHPTERYTMSDGPPFPMAPPQYGAVTIHEKTAGEWQQGARLEPHDLAPLEESAKLGTSIALNHDGTLLAAGAPMDDATPGIPIPIPPERDEVCWEFSQTPPCHPPGATYLYEQTPQGWEQTAKLTPTEGPPGDPRLESTPARFGSAIALTPADDILIGAPAADHLPTDDAGAAYVFEHLTDPMEG